MRPPNTLKLFFGKIFNSYEKYIYIYFFFYHFKIFSPKKICGFSQKMYFFLHEGQNHQNPTIVKIMSLERKKILRDLVSKLLILFVKKKDYVINQLKLMC